MGQRPGMPYWVANDWTAVWSAEEIEYWEIEVGPGLRDQPVCSRPRGPGRGRIQLAISRRVPWVTEDALMTATPNESGSGCAARVLAGERASGIR